MIRTLMAVAICAVSMALPAFAQLSRDGGQIQIGADKWVVKELEKQAIYSGNVDAVQGDARLRADELVINFTGVDVGPEGGVSGGFGELKNMIATGDVFYITSDLRVRGDRGTYEASTDTVTLLGNVSVLRGEDVAKGDCLTLDLTNGITTLGCGEGQGTGARPVTIISPPERSNPPPETDDTEE